MLNTMNQLTHNTYVSVKILGELSRGIAEFYDNVPFDSECLHWILYKESPKTLGNYESAIMCRNLNMQYVEKMLEHVYDTKIRNQVKHSVFRSLKCGYLAYVYGSIDDIDMQARIRILTRRILDHFYLYKSADSTE